MFIAKYRATIDGTPAEGEMELEKRPVYLHQHLQNLLYQQTGAVNVRVHSSTLHDKEGGARVDGPELRPRRLDLFVYGSLKRGQGNHAHFLPEAEAEYVGRAIVRGRAQMLDLGAFPALALGVGMEETAVLCEAYSVTEDVALSIDVLEGYPAFYNRSNAKGDVYRPDGSAPFEAEARLYHVPAKEASNVLKAVAPNEHGVVVWRESDDEREFLAQALGSA